MWGWSSLMPTLAPSPRCLSPLTRAWSLPEGTMCSAYRESCVFLGGQSEEGRKSHGLWPLPQGTWHHRNIITPYRVQCPFTSPVPLQQPCERQAGQTVLPPFHRWGNRLDKVEWLAEVIQPVRALGQGILTPEPPNALSQESPLTRPHFQSQVPIRHCRQCQGSTLIQVKAT